MAILERDDKNAVAYLTLNSPNSLNALSDEMLAALKSTFDALATDRTVRAVVIKGAGKAFCAGHDLKQMTAGRAQDDGGAAYFKDLFDRCAQMMLSIRNLPQPVIAQVHGIATAAGCQLVATCDLAVAETSTRFGVNGVNIGLFCSTPMVALTRNIARKQAFELLTTGEFIDAERAQALGLINRSVALDDLSTTVSKLAEQIAAKSSSAVRIGKSAFYDQLEMGVEAAYAYTGAVMVENLMEGDAKEGISAFLDKRTPKWEHE